MTTLSEHYQRLLGIIVPAAAIRLLETYAANLEYYRQMAMYQRNRANTLAAEVQRLERELAKVQQ